MNFTIHRDELLGALLKLQSVLEKKNTVQILANVLCSVKEKTLYLCATDLEVGMKIALPVTDSQDGKTTLSGKHFFDIVKELPSKPLKVSRKSNDWVEIISGKSRFNVVSLSAEEFPTLPSFEEKNYIDAKVPALADMIEKTAFAVSSDATRYHLNGVFFEAVENHLIRMTATDGHRLSFVEHEVFLKTPDTSQIKKGIIIPKKGLLEVSKLLDASDKEYPSIGLAFDPGYFYAKSDQTYLFVRLIEGQYPDCQQVIPKNADLAVKIHRDSFISALRRVSLLAHEKSRGVKLSFKPQQLLISSSSPEMGEANEELEVDYQGQPLEIGFNARYLLDCLPTLHSDYLELKFKDRLSPGILQGIDTRNHTYIIMPMRI